jgi:hypothetical protein
MAFVCTGPFNNATAPLEACSSDAWLMHAASITLGLLCTLFLILLANDLTTLSALSTQEEQTAAQAAQKALSSLMEGFSSVGGAGTGSEALGSGGVRVSARSSLRTLPPADASGAVTSNLANEIQSEVPHYTCE